MAHPWINRELYEAILHFEESDAAQEYYYRVMDTEVERNGKRDTVRNQILRAYAMLYLGEARFDPKHWYRMRYHFPVIDEDNYDRFAALVISDLNAGPAHDAAKEGGEMLLVGALSPLTISPEERQHQNLRPIHLQETEKEGGEA